MGTGRTYAYYHARPVYMTNTILTTVRSHPGNIYLAGSGPAWPVVVGWIIGPAECSIAGSYLYRYWDGSRYGWGTICGRVIKGPVITILYG